MLVQAVNSLSPEAFAAAEADCGGSVSVRIGAIKNSEYAESMVVFKVTDAKLRRYVLAVSINRIVSLLTAFKLHRDFARAALSFRRVSSLCYCL